MTYVCFYYRQIYHIYIYCLVKNPFHKEWDIHYFGIPQLDVFASARLVRLPTPPFFQAALRGEKYHEALDAAERAIALTGGRTHWVSATGNRREVVGCSEGSFFFLPPIRVHIKKIVFKKWSLEKDGKNEETFTCKVR